MYLIVLIVFGYNCVCKCKFCINKFDCRYLCDVILG